MKTLSMQRPRPSMLMRTPAPSTRWVKSAARELAALIGVENLGPAPGQGLLQRRQTNAASRVLAMRQEST